MHSTPQIGTYVPNAGQNLKAMDDKVAWNEAFKTYLHQLDAKKSVVWLGDLNVCHDSNDIRNDKSNWNKSAGWTETEVNGYKDQLSDKFVDAWKVLVSKMHCVGICMLMNDNL